MDPVTALGVAGATVNLLDGGLNLSKALMKSIRAWRHAPDEILEMNNRVAFLNVALERVKDTCWDMQEGSQPNSSLETILLLEHQLGQAASSLEKLTGYAAQLSRGSKTIQRTRWIRLKSAVVEETRRIRDVQSNIDNVLVSYVAGTVTSTHRNVHLVLDGVESITSAVCSPVIGEHPLKGELWGQKTRQLSVETLYRTELDRKPIEPPWQRPGPEHVAITARYSRVRCFQGCLCQCHRGSGARTRFHARNPLGGLLGGLSVGYSGYGVRPKCDLIGCWHRGRSHLEVTYIFPSWLIRYTLYMSMYKTAMGGPTFGLVLRRRVQNTTGSTLYVSLLSNMTLLQECLERDPSSVTDAFYMDGVSALESAVSYGRINVIRMLLSYGASPDAESDGGMTPGLAAAISVLSKANSKEVSEQLYRLFNIQRYIDELELPLVTQVVTEQRSGDIESLLGQADLDRQLNEHDRAGLTPLFWAARCGNVTATKQLIALGADINGRTANWKTPLIATVSTDIVSPCFEVLLRAGADPYARDRIGKTALHLACARGHAAAVAALLRTGMDPDDGWETGAGLLYAPIRDAVDVMRALVRKGANVNVLTVKEGYSPLISATARNAHRCIRFLLENGADHLHVMHAEGTTMLHTVAYGGTPATMAILAEHGLPGLDVGRKNKDGLTAWQCLEKRSDINDELREAFRHLLDAVMAGDNSTLKGRDTESEGEDTDENETEDVFFDAVESQRD